MARAAKAPHHANLQLSCYVKALRTLDKLGLAGLTREEMLEAL
jgi:hypothetical protein